MDELKSELGKSVQFKGFTAQIKSLLDTGLHSDVTFTFSNDSRTIAAHKAILSARSQYFEAMFRVGGMIESFQDEIAIPHTSYDTFYMVLEFIYSNDLDASRLATYSTDQWIDLLIVSNEYLLEELRVCSELELRGKIDLENVGRLLLLASGHNAAQLKIACFEFIAMHKAVLYSDMKFRQLIEGNSELGLLLFECSVISSPSSTSSAITNLSNLSAVTSSYLYSQQHLLQSQQHPHNLLTASPSDLFLSSQTIHNQQKRRRSSSHVGVDSSHGQSDRAEELDLIPPQLNMSTVSQSSSSAFPIVASLTGSQTATTTAHTLPAPTAANIANFLSNDSFHD
jgi:hypothetical protein